jgi:hypothetical protein
LDLCCAKLDFHCRRRTAGNDDDTRLVAAGCDWHIFNCPITMILTAAKQKLLFP